MTHSQMHAGIAIGATVLVGALIAFLPPVPPASAQSHAQRICREEGVKPTTEILLRILSFPDDLCLGMGRACVGSRLCSRGRGGV